jgi:hypothetical protein
MSGDMISKNLPVPSFDALTKWKSLGAIFDDLKTLENQLEKQGTKRDALRWCQAKIPSSWQCLNNEIWCFPVNEKNMVTVANYSQKTAFYDPYLIVCFNEKQSNEQQQIPKETIMNQEFQDLIAQWNQTLSYFGGCFAQHSDEIRNQHSKFNDFMIKYPDFDQRLIPSMPQDFKAEDTRMGGSLGGAMNSLAQDGEPCCVQ